MGCSRCFPAVTVMQRGICAHLYTVGIMRKNAPKTGRTWRSEENRKVLAQNRSNVYKTSFFETCINEEKKRLAKKFRIISRGAKSS